MRCMAAGLIAVSLIASATLSAAAPARAETDAEIEQIVRRQVQPMLIAAGGMAVALNIDGRTLLFNYGLADVARKAPITSDSLFNLASLGKAFTATLLAQAVKQGEVALDDRVATSPSLSRAATSAASRSASSRATPRGSSARRTNPSRGTADRIHSPTSSATSTPGRRTRRTYPASRTSIPLRASCCWRWRCSGASTRLSAAHAGAAP